VRDVIEINFSNATPWEFSATSLRNVAYRPRSFSASNGDEHSRELLRARHKKARPITESALIFAAIMSVDRVRRARESFSVSSIVAILILAPDTKAKKTNAVRGVIAV